VGRACCLLFGAFGHCGQCTVGRFGGWVGRCSVAAAGEPWLTMGCEGVWRRAEALAVAGATGWEWRVDRACCPCFVVFRHCGQRTVGRFGGRSGAAVSPRLASRGWRWSLCRVGCERKRWRWLEPRGGSGGWVERLPMLCCVSSLRPVHGRSVWGSFGRCGVAAAGEPWFAMGCEGVWRRAEV
jgi:hypothetical protein